MKKERQVLIIFPHPDDEAFATAGTITKYVSENVPVTYLCMTLGEMGRNLGSPLFAHRENLANFRKKELYDSANILGINVIEMGFRDKTIEFLDENEVAKEVLKIIKKINPTLVISFYPPYAVHPDHNACGKIVITAMKMLSKKERPKLHLVAFSNNCEKDIGEANVIVDIRQYAEKKLSAIRAHKSQTESMTTDWDKMFEQTDPKVKNRFMAEKFWEYCFE